jgi:geranylgeranyl diphosphate synthase type II
MSLNGKRLRPLLTLLAYSLYRKDVRRIVGVAVAVESFHNFTLLHDDIMDRAPLRRGKPTVHKKWNTNTAILAGDVMLVKVYDMLLGVPEDKLKDVLGAFNACAAEVCEGQQQDMEFEKAGIVSEKEYLNMIRKKTAVLLGFSMELGAILAGASAADKRALREFGINIGVGFQLKDDLLDVYGDKKKFGKLVGGDIIANKKTFLLINALSRARGKEAAVLRKWIGQGENKDEQAKVKEITAIYDKLGLRSMTERKISGYFNRGFANLDTLHARSTQKKYLRDHVAQLINRQS